MDPVTVMRINAVLTRALLAFDAFLTFSVLFAILFAAVAGARTALAGLRGLRGSGGTSGALSALLIASAALILQHSPVGDSLVFILFDAFTAVNMRLIGWFGWTPLVLYSKVYIPALLLLWVAGCCLCLAFLAVQYARLRRELARLPDFRDAEEIAAACAAAGLRGGARVKAAGKMRQVGSWGIFRAWILVPDDFAECFAPEERRWIYLHELTHYKRRDALRYLALALWRACFWFNPACARAASDARRSFEFACDAAVVRRHGADPLQYSRLIVKTAALDRGMPIGFASGFGDIGKRIANLLGARPARSARRTACGAIVAVAAAGAIVLLHARAPEKREFSLSRIVSFVGKDGLERRWRLEHGGRYGAFARYTFSAEVQDVPPPAGRAPSCQFL